MIKKIKKLNIFKKGPAQYRRHKSSGSGFVILFAVTLAALLLSIALGVANIALKEIKFGTSARDTNEAFFAADSGIEQALFNDKLGNSSNFIVSGLGSSGQGCANVSIDKSSGTTIISKGYNIGDSPACSPSNPNRVERELVTTYGGSASPPPVTTQQPAQTLLGSSGFSSSTYTANYGYKFSSDVNGQVTQLGMYSDGNSHTVTLYNQSDGTVLAQTTLSGSGWVYGNITPVNITSSTNYIVAINTYNYYYKNFSLPATSGDITISASGYGGGSIYMPTLTDTGTMLGMTDITFKPGSTATPPSGFANHRLLTVQGSQISTINHTPLSSFTVLVSASLNTANVKNSSGYDIVFTSDAGCSTMLNWEMESYNSGNLLAWVKMPSPLNFNVDSTFYMCYNNSAISSFQGGAVGSVWDSNYKGVWHLPTSLGLNDSTASGANFGNNGGVSAATGKIDGGAVEDGHDLSSLGVTNSNIVGLADLTWSMWVNPTALQNAGNDSYMGLITTNNKALRMRTSGSLWMEQITDNSYRQTSSNETLSTGSWQKVDVVFDNSVNKYRIYINGTECTYGQYAFNAGSGTIYNDTGSDLIIGASEPNIYYGNLYGKFDEIRISNSRRSADWIKTEYNNQSSPASFCSVGAEQ